MRNLSKKSISLVLIFTTLMAIFMPTMVSAGTIGRIGGQRVTFTETNTSSEQVASTTNMEEYINSKKDAFEKIMTSASITVDLNYSNIDPNTLFSTTSPYKYATADSCEVGYAMIEGTLTQVYTVNYTTVNVTKSSTPPSIYIIQFNSNGGSSVNSQSITGSGYKVSRPADPTKDNNNFVGWYSDEGLTNAWNFDTVVTSSMTLYAKWEPSTLSNIELNATFTGTEGEIVINNERTPEGRGYNGTLNNAGYTDSNNNNKIVVNTSFGMQPAKKITINGTNYDCNGTYSNEYQVPGASSYTITIEADTGAVTPKTIIWANPGATDIDAEDALIKNGSAKIVAVYDENGNKLNYKDYTNQQEQPDGSKSDEYGLNNGNGWAVVKPGYKVEFEFTPEYGYQLTKVMANEQTLAPQETANHYTFTMPDTNVHFAATFTKTEDIVKADSDKVSSGSIQLGNKLDGGTVQLSVSNVELSADKIKGFEGAAEGYTVSNYLDIDLYNVFYKGKADSDDVWSNKIDELDKEATISLKLADGLTADDIVIVHNIHDGEEYEVIKIDSYDPETNTITFKTKSFSNYAIATKASSTETTTTDNSKNPKTGDNIAITISIFAIATLGVFTTLKVNKNRRVRKH